MLKENHDVVKMTLVSLLFSFYTDKKEEELNQKEEELNQKDNNLKLINEDLPTLDLPAIAISGTP